jgi:hypothetical protein
VPVNSIKDLKIIQQACIQEEHNTCIRTTIWSASRNSWKKFRLIHSFFNHIPLLSHALHAVSIWSAIRHIRFLLLTWVGTLLFMERRVSVCMSHLRDVSLKARRGMVVSYECCWCCDVGPGEGGADFSVRWEVPWSRKEDDEAHCTVRDFGRTVRTLVRRFRLNLN